MPRTSRPCFKTRAVRSHSARRLARTAASALSTGQVFVETREVAGQFVKIIAEKIRAVFFRHRFERQPEIQQMLGQREFFRAPIGCWMLDVECSMLDVPSAFRKMLRMRA